MSTKNNKILFLSTGTIIKECGYKNCFLNRVYAINSIKEGEKLFILSFDLYYSFKESQNVVNNLNVFGIDTNIYPFERGRNIVQKAVNIIKHNLIVLKYCKKNKISLINAVGHSALLRCILVKYLSTTKILFYLDGVHFDEKYSQRKRLYPLLKSIEKRMILSSDGISFVSSAMKDYYSTITNLPKNIVIPNSVDFNLFSFSQEKRTEMRFMLEVQNKFVFAYAGEIFEEWHLGKEMIKIFKYIKQRLPQSYFLVLSSDNREKVLHLFMEEGLCEKDYLLKKVRHYEVPSYLFASDVAFLIRQKNLINYVASPTKAAEYLASGLPLITTEGIGDISSIIRENNLGIILDDFTNVKEMHKVVEWISKNDLTETRNKCIQIAYDMFNLEKHKEKMKKFIEELIDE